MARRQQVQAPRGDPGSLLQEMLHCLMHVCYNVPMWLQALADMTRRQVTRSLSRRHALCRCMHINLHPRRSLKFARPQASKGAAQWRTQGTPASHQCARRYQPMHASHANPHGCRRRRTSRGGARRASPTRRQSSRRVATRRRPGCPKTHSRTGKSSSATRARR